MHSLQTEGFRWHRIRDYFPFGDVSLREGNYQRLLDACIACLRTANDKQLLIDILDVQACAFTEQVWVANEMADRAAEEKPFRIEAHFSTAWLQINDNVRSKHGLEQRNTRGAMLGLHPPETLAARITGNFGSNASGA